MTDPVITRLTALIQQQAEAMETERKESTKREERMQALLENAIHKLPNIDENASARPPQSATKIPSNATPAPHLSHNASLREFVTWKQKFNDYILLTGVDKASNNRQKAVLRSLLDDEWFRVTKFALNIDMELEATSVDAVIQTMQNHLRSQRNIVIDRKEFYLRNQQLHERFDDYYMALQEIAGFCDFCVECLDQQYRDRIITGIRDEETIKELLTQPELTLEQAISICRAKENANKDKENLQTASSDIQKISNYKKSNFRKSSSPTRFYNKENQRSTKEPDKYQNGSENRKCKYCGGAWHQRLIQCPGRKATCNKCHKFGHFAKACLQSVEYREYIDGDVYRITVADISDNMKKSPKVKLTVKVGDKAILIDATPDTGAEVSVISPYIAKKLGINLNNLYPGHHNMYAANGNKLTCLGTIKSEISLGKRQLW